MVDVRSLFIGCRLEVVREAPTDAKFLTTFQAVTHAGSVSVDLYQGPPRPVRDKEPAKLGEITYFAVPNGLTDEEFELVALARSAEA